MMTEKDLVQLMNERHGSRNQFSRATGIPTATLTRIFREGIQTTSVRIADKVCKGLGISLEDVANPVESRIGEDSNTPSAAGKKLYERYLSATDSQAAINELLGYTPPSFSDKILELLNSQGYNKVSFAKAIDIPLSTLKSILKRGISSATLANAQKISSGLGLTVSKLLEYEDSTTYDDGEAAKFYMLYQTHRSAQKAIDILLKAAS